MASNLTVILTKNFSGTQLIWLGSSGYILFWETFIGSTEMKDEEWLKFLISQFQAYVYVL